MFMQRVELLAVYEKYDSVKTIHKLSHKLKTCTCGTANWDTCSCKAAYSNGGNLKYF